MQGAVLFELVVDGDDEDDATIGLGGFGELKLRPPPGLEEKKE